ncbi:MAG: lipopolysaccharide biosynthesis protein [Bacteroidota bacterium]
MRDKLRQLSKDTAVYGISTILSRFLTFILVPFYSHMLGKADNGIIGAIYAYIAFLNILYLYGMDTAYLKYASIYMQEKKKDVFSSPFLSVVFSSAVISMLFYVFRGPVNEVFQLPDRYSYILNYIVLILFFDALSAVPFAYLRIVRKAKKFALIKTINILINVVLNIVLLRMMKMGIEAVFIANLAASVITMMLLLPDILENFHLRIDKDLFRLMLKFGMPYLPASLASMVIQVIDRPILLRLTDDATVGLYQINYKLGIFMMLFVSMFQYAWQPFFLHNAKESNAKEIFSRVLTWFVLAGSTVLVMLSLFIEDLVKASILNVTLIDSRYWSGLSIVPVILAGYLFNGIYVNLTAGILIQEKTKYIPYVTALGAIVNIAVNFALIPVWGITGAAMATFLSYVFMAAGLYLVSRHFYPIDYEYGKLLKILIAVTITAVLYYLFGFTTILLKILLVALYSIMIVLFGVVSGEEIKSIKTVFLRRKAA